MNSILWSGKCYTKLYCAALVCATCGRDPEAICYIHWGTQLTLCPSGSSDKWTNQTSDQRSHIQVPMLCMEIRPSPCLCIDESTSVSSPTSAWDFPQVAWHFIGKYFHLQHIIYCSLSHPLTAIASHRLWQRPLQIALMGEFWAHSSSKDGFTLCQKR